MTSITARSIEKENETIGTSGAADKTSTGSLDVEAVRAGFPILDREVNGKPLAYLDNAASAQRPTSVTAAIDHCYEHYYANIHRGVHTLSQESTAAYEEARSKVARALGAEDPKEIIFVRGTTEGINLVASSWGRVNLSEGDQVLVTELEHHSNIVPWQMLCEQTGAELRVAPIDDDGDLSLDVLEGLLGPRVKVLAVTHVSNALGTITPLREIIERAHRHGVVVVVDGAQGVPHLSIDVTRLDADFYVFSGHKAYGPSGIGAVYGKRRHLDAMPPWQGGGGMIKSVTFERTTYADVPARFEAGTPDIAGAIGLGAAMDFLSTLGVEAIASWEHTLLERARSVLSQVAGVRLIGNPREQAGVLSFLVDGIHPHDLGTILDQEGIAVRAGHHCAQPLMDRLGIPATVRASFACYNTLEEADRLAAAVEKARHIFGLGAP